MKKKATHALTLGFGGKICPKSKRSQEEMVGFALIIIIVAVILLVFLGFSLRSSQKEIVESYEVDSFIQAFLQYTTDCADTYEPNYLSIQKLIIECDKGETCLDERYTCDVLDSELTKILEESWKTGEDWPVKGYELNITSNKEELLSIKQGNTTREYKWATQDFSKGGDSIEILFTAYY